MGSRAKSGYTATRKGMLWLACFFLSFLIGATFSTSYFPLPLFPRISSIISSSFLPVFLFFVFFSCCFPFFFTAVSFLSVCRYYLPLFVFLFSSLPLCLFFAFFILSSLLSSFRSSFMFSSLSFVICIHFLLIFFHFHF